VSLDTNGTNSLALADGDESPSASGTTIAICIAVSAVVLIGAAVSVAVYVRRARRMPEVGVTRVEGVGLSTKAGVEPLNVVSATSDAKPV